MRFDTKKGKPLADWINKATENDIKEVLYKYGDEKHAKLISLILLNIEIKILLIQHCS